MPGWLNQLLLWGGIALVIVFAVALIWVESTPAPEEGTEPFAPTELYWGLLIIGAVAALAGYFLGRRQPPPSV